MRKLAPLNAIKAFEAAARRGGYVGAAEELGVSPAAVSQQIKVLEGYLNKQLFIRHSNRITLTDAGASIYPEATEALQTLCNMTERVLDGHVRSNLVISVPASIATRWMSLHLPEFLRQEPGIKMDIRVEDDPVDLARGSIDLRLCFGAAPYPEMAVTEWLSDEAVPLCSPEFLALARKDAGERGVLADENLIHLNWGEGFASHPSWSEWFKMIGEDRLPDIRQGQSVGLSSMAIDLAAAGVGVALGQRLLAQEELKSGKLVQLSDRGIPLKHSYCLVYPQPNADKPSLRKFLDWMESKKSDDK